MLLLACYCLTHLPVPATASPAAPALTCRPAVRPLPPREPLPSRVQTAIELGIEPDWTRSQPASRPASTVGGSRKYTAPDPADPNINPYASMMSPLGFVDNSHNYLSPGR